MTEPQGVRVTARQLAELDEEQAGAVRHIHDVDHYYTGSEGEWTVCGDPWPPPDNNPDAVNACPKCLEKWVPAHERGSRS